MSSSKTATCRSCNAEIFWATTQSGKKIPIDKTPRTDGNLGIEHRIVDGQKRAFTCKPAPQRNRFVSHFATCKSAHMHRKAR